jgi:ribosomal 50S subunit-associated protein YjgA (DUF615 family)
MGNITKRYLYLLEIVPQDKEIIITKCEKMLWSLIPMSDEAFIQILRDYPGYDVCELDENFLRAQGDRHSYMNPN